MRPRALLLLPLLLTACGGGRGAVRLTVDSSSAVAGVQALQVVAILGGQTAAPVLLRLPGAPLTIPPARTIALTFDPDRRGQVTLRVDALDAASATVATATIVADVVPGELREATIFLGGVGTLPDLAAPRDLATPSDLAAAPDLATGGDAAATAADLATTADLASPPADLTSGDLAVGPNPVSVTAGPVGLGRARSAGGNFVVEGAFGARPRAAGGNLSIEPLLPWR